MTKDLAELDELKAAQDEGLDVEIFHPVSGEPLGFTITIAGPDSAKQEEARRKQTDARIQRRGVAPMTAEEIKVDALKFLCGTIIRWSPFQLDGKPLELTDANALALFQRFPWIAEQVDAKAASRAGFTKRSAKGSSPQSGTKA
jgi:hypothetical protein